ncbi:hypothetical protein R70723_06555 [Paenibacillus sp. FSL R7-0273]|uniref:hypothetical protein n=1 Tax=Paenibacillus sp. FSL R7-0273 TaxID=1536772 RepID=UPI0004F5D83A|nr:hypothetical protein [Paenibacillus sp. FSL R7-0273]AIQ45595.1 hypothetical protein R70723_06555 [Paenibacillus sp. FSL R7-0273]OMF95111.1 hypothetical protein BK144_06135 [Paenibacillus sp. FSL R7-0273]
MIRVTRKISDNELKARILLYKRLERSATASGHMQVAAYCRRQHNACRELLTAEWDKPLKRLRAG